MLIAAHFKGIFYICNMGQKLKIIVKIFLEEVSCAVFKVLLFDKKYSKKKKWNTVIT